MRPTRWLVLAIGLLLAPASAFAQSSSGAVSTQAVPSETRASQVCVDTRPATGSAATATLTPPAGWYLYLNTVEINATVGGAAVATASNPAHASSTNLNGATFGMFPLAAQAAGSKIDSFFYALSGNGMKSAAAGTAVTISTPAFTNVNWHIHMCGYYAP